MSDPESVAAVLASTWAGDCEALYEHLTCDRPAEELCYDDWVQPMEATAGRICLKVATPTGDRWLRWSAREAIDCCLRSEESLEVKPDWPSDSTLEHWLDRYEVDPVLIEDTPFAIVGGPGRQEVPL